MKKEKQLVSARELHEKLILEEGKEERFSQWFKRHLQYGFEENIDFTSVKIFTVVNNGAKRELQDYAITIDMAKEICMLQKSDKGREFRKYFIECEKKLKTQVPQLTDEQKLALLVFDGGFSAVEASKKMVELRTKPLLETIETQKPKVEYVDKFMNGDGLFLISEIAKKVGITAVRANNILKENKIIYKNGKSIIHTLKHPKIGMVIKRVLAKMVLYIVN